MTDTPHNKTLDLVERFLERTEVRILLASFIVVSVLPLPWSSTIDAVLLPIFAMEFGFRIAILRRSGTISRGDRLLLLADAVALITFLPIQELIGTSALRLLRLARLFVLVRFFRAVVSDLRGILARRQIRYQLGFLVVTVLLLTLVAGTLLSALEVPIEDFDGDSQPDRGNLGQIIWWSFRQLEDPGNLIEDAHGEVSLLVVSLFLTIAGVFIMSFIIGIGTSVVGALMRATQNRRVPFRDHTVVVGGGRNTQQVLTDLVDMYAKNRRRVRIAVLDADAQPPAYLEDPTFRGVEYRTGEAPSLAAHDLLATDASRRVIVLNNDERGEASDAYVISSLLAARQRCADNPVTAELRHRRYIDVAKVAGHVQTNPIPMGMFLGSSMSQNLMFPGIDAVFEELLSARGSEIYTHIFTEKELEALREIDGDSLEFKTLLVNGFRDHGVILLGVFLGSGAWTYDVGKLTLWLNPLDEPEEEARALGASPGMIPSSNLRGVAAVAPEYSTLQRAARSLSSLSRRSTSPGRPAATHLEASLCHDMLDLRNVLVLGDNELLPAMLENTAEFVEGVRFLVGLSTAGRQRELAAELKRRGIPGESRKDHEATMEFILPKGSSALLFHGRGDILSDALSHPLINERTLDAVVLLADPTESDPDATSTLTLLRLHEMHRQQQLEVSPLFRIIAEVLADAKGALLEHRLEKDSLAIVRIISTRRMRAYFLVHGAYVPGLANIYLELLTPKGQDFCQLHLSENGAGKDGTMTFTTLLEDLSQAQPPVIPFALKLSSDHPSAGLLLNPQGAEREVRFRPSQVEAIYAVGETQRFPR